MRETRNMTAEACAIDKHGLEGSTLTASPLLMSSGAAAPPLFQVESIPVLAGLSTGGQSQGWGINIEFA